MTGRRINSPSDGITFRPATRSLRYAQKETACLRPVFLKIAILSPVALSTADRVFRVGLPRADSMRPSISRETPRTLGDLGHATARFSDLTERRQVSSGVVIFRRCIQILRGERGVLELLVKPVIVLNIMHVRLLLAIRASA